VRSHRAHRWRLPRRAVERRQTARLSSPVHAARVTAISCAGSLNISDEYPELDRLQAEYRNAVEAWIAAIRSEEALASVNHTVAEVDKWESAHFAEDEMRSNVKDAKARYEDALRAKFFGF
jgi:GTP1/Obg family GTP-binding protein